MARPHFLRAINKAFSIGVTRSYYQTQTFSMTVDNFLFLTQQMKQFLEK